MNDFGSKIKAAEREVKAKAQSTQSSKLPIKKKRAAPRSAWKKGEVPKGATPFKPGQSGNPGGRPSMKPISDAMRALFNEPYDGKEAKYRGMTNAQVLARKQFELAINQGDMRAAQELADRVEGKVPQGLQHSGPGGAPMEFSEVSPEENERKIAALLAKASGFPDAESE